MTLITLANCSILSTVDSIVSVHRTYLQVVEVLLEKSSGRHVYEAVLQAISAGHVQIAESILKHKRYLELWKERKKLGDDDHFFKTQFEESQVWQKKPQIWYMIGDTFIITITRLCKILQFFTAVKTVVIYWTLPVLMLVLAVT